MRENVTRIAVYVIAFALFLWVLIVGGGAVMS